VAFKVMNLTTIRMSVDNIQISCEWYKSFFGIEPIENQENFVSFQIGDMCLDLSIADDKSPVSRGGSIGYWLVDDLDAAISAATNLGGKIYRGPLRVNEIQRTIVQIIDPQGNVFGLEAAR
jgi:uncharacterized protein